MNDREKLVLRLSAAQFACWETRVYLDTHPDDTAAYAMLKKYEAVAVALKEEFVSLYGPLYAVGENNDMWLRDPWPWDNEKGDK